VVPPTYLRLPEAVALDVGGRGPVLLGQPGLPEMGGLDDVVVHADDHRDLGHGGLLLGPVSDGSSETHDTPLRAAVRADGV
jgi:hypothetical protein